MRAAMVLALGLPLAACAPDIVPGAYLCGPEQACPDGLTCDGVEDVCVLPTGARPFACSSAFEQEPNDGPEAAQPLAVLDRCVTALLEVPACATGADAEDWYELVAPAGCTAVAVRVRVVFRGAYEELGLELHGEAGALVTAERCVNDAADDGDEVRCLEHTLTAGERYTVRVHRTGEGDCGGACAYNRYTLTTQLFTP